jgi:hypothetical protein
MLACFFVGQHKTNRVLMMPMSDANENCTDDAGRRCEEDVVFGLVIGAVLIETRGVEDEGIDQFDRSN